MYISDDWLLSKEECPDTSTNWTLACACYHALANEAHKGVLPPETVFSSSKVAL